MTEAVVSGKETRCLFINNGDDLLTLKKVVSKKSDKDDGEKQRNQKSKEINGSELNGTHNKTDSINFDIDNTSSLEPNLEMDSDTDRNITIDDSVCTQEDRELEIIDNSNENSIETDLKNGEKDNLVLSTRSIDNVYSPSDSLEDIEYSHDLEDVDLDSDNIKSPGSFFNISSRAPLHSADEFDITFEEDILPLKTQVLINENKRKYEDQSEPGQKSSKMLKLWNIMKYPFQKITVGTSVTDNESSVSKAEIITEKENSETPITSDNKNDISETDETDTTEVETQAETEKTSENDKNITKFCRIM